MKSLLSLMMMCGLVVACSGNSAHAGPHSYIGGPIPIPEHGAIIGEPQYYPSLELYRNVKIHNPRNVDPCAVEKIVAVPDPCDPCQCVLISICVPPCACEEVIVHPRKDRVTFDYGKYKVRVTERGGKLHVTYLK